MSEYISRMFKKGDKEELNDLYNLVAGRKRSLRFFSSYFIIYFESIVISKIHGPLK